MKRKNVTNSSGAPAGPDSFANYRPCGLQARLREKQEWLRQCISEVVADIRPDRPDADAMKKEINRILQQLDNSLT